MPHFGIARFLAVEARARAFSRLDAYMTNAPHRPRADAH